jgi:hypothetical protein
LKKTKMNREDIRKRLKLEVLSLCKSKEELDQEERRLIKHYDAQNPTIGYNRTTGGSGRKSKLSEATKEKIRQANVGRKTSKETKEKLRIALTGDRNPMFGKKGKSHHLFGLTGVKNPRQNFHHSEETREKIKNNTPNRSGENNPFYAKRHSKESKEKMSISRSGKNSHNAIRLKAINQRTKEELVFLSLKDAGIHFNVADGRIFLTRAINLEKHKSLDIRTATALDWNFYLM